MSIPQPTPEGSILVAVDVSKPRNDVLIEIPGKARRIIRPDVLRRTMDGEQIDQAVQHVVGVQLASNDDGRAAAREFIDDRQQAEDTSILRPILDKIIGPDVPGALRPKPDARLVIQPETAAFWLFLWDFQPFQSPDPVDPFKVHPPAFYTQQSPHAPIAIAAIGIAPAGVNFRQQELYPIDRTRRPSASFRRRDRKSVV